MRTRTNLLIDAVTLTAYLLAANPAITGIAVHEYVSLGFALVALVHLVLHRDWVVRTVRRFAGRLANASRLNLVVAALTGAAIASVTVSGLAVSQTLSALLGLTSASTPLWHALHAVSAIAVLLVGLLHVALHWGWIVSTARLHVLAPLRRSITGATGTQRTARAVAWGVPAILATGLLALACFSFAGSGTVANAAPVAASLSGSSTGTLTCPRTGCTAATCHATAGGGTGSGAFGGRG